MPISDYDYILQEIAKDNRRVGVDQNNYQIRISSEEPVLTQPEDDESES